MSVRGRKWELWALMIFLMVIGGLMIGLGFVHNDSVFVLGGGLAWFFGGAQAKEIILRQKGLIKDE